MEKQRNALKITGFTLIEILVVAAIVMTLAVAGIPALSQFGSKMEFSDKKTEIEMLLSQVILKSRSPDKGFVRYQADVDTSAKTVTLYRYPETGSREQVRQVVLNGSQSIALSTTNTNFYCKVPGRECGHLAGSDTPITALETFLTLSDSSTSSISSVSYKIRPDPFIIQAQ